ncbi:hypothetical protein KC992_03700, partial [Candidatus Saccharibacteria bacterium]|nr:hypothetical protein [Candidatus Saccharibacteria bacterium]
MNRISTSIFVVTVACASIALHITISGPRLTGVTENNLAGTKSLVFHFNTKLDETQKPKFNVTPEVKNELRIGSDFIELTFIEPLKSGTHYTIEVGEIYDTRSKQTTIRYQFETSPQSIAYLQR